jgi:hypothetical protein
MINDETKTGVRDETADAPRSETYEHPEVKDYGSLKELTLSGTSPLSDSWGGASGGGS